MTKTNAQTKTAAKTAKVNPLADAKVAAEMQAVIDAAKTPEAKAKAEQARKDGMPLAAVKALASGRKMVSDKDLAFTPPAKPKLTSGKAQLARGITAKDAQQSAKAVADQHKGAAKATNKADAATQKPAEAKKAARKAEAAAAKGDRKYKLLVKLSDITLRDGTWTKVMVETAMDHTSTDAANAALAKNREYGSRKIDWKWLADTRHYIKFA